MAITQLLLLLIASSTLTLSQTISPNAMATIMQEILSPRNTEQLSQMLQGATNRLIAHPELPLMSAKRKTIVETGPRVSPNKIVVQGPSEIVPRNVGQKIVPNKVVVQSPSEIVIPKNVVRQNAIPNNVIVKNQNEVLRPLNVAVQANEIVPTKYLVRKPELANNKVLVNNEVGVPNRKILVQKANEIPLLKNLVLQNGNPEVVRIPNGKTVALQQVARPVAEISGASRMVDAINSNPFLPAASPVYPLTVPTANVVPQSRGQFLRKIPIPPPTI